MGFRCPSPYMALLYLLFCALEGSAQSGDTTRLSISEAVEQALRHHPARSGAKAAQSGARSAVSEAEAARYPSFSFSSSLTRHQEPMVVTPIHGFTPGAFPPFDRTLIQAGLFLNYTLFDAGTRAGRIGQTRALAEEAETDVARAEQSLIAQVIDLYLTIVSQRQIRDAHTSRLRALEAEQTRTRQLYEQGRAADLDRLRVAVALAAAQAESIQTASLITFAEREMARITGLPEQRARAAYRPAAERIPRSQSRETLTTQALQSNPTLEGAQRQRASIEAAVQIARSLRWPALSLNGGYVDRGSIRGDHKAEWSLGIQITYPIFTGGQIRSAIRRAEASRQAADEQIRHVEIEIRREVDQALSAIETAGARRQSLAIAVERAEEVVRIEKLRMEAGVGIQNDYLRAEADLLALRAALSEAGKNEITGHVHLARIQGTLTSEWIKANLEEFP